MKAFAAAGALGGSPFYSPAVLTSREQTAAAGAVISCATLNALGVKWQTIRHAIFPGSAVGIDRIDRLMPAGGAKVEEGRRCRPRVAVCGSRWRCSREREVTLVGAAGHARAS